MGEQDITDEVSARERRVYLNALLDDVRALEHMLEHDLLESGVRRIGAEQELFLVDEHWKPAPLAMELLEAAADSHFTTELARFNVEFNSDPLVFGGDALSRLEASLLELLAKARRAAEAVGARLVMVGALPTLNKSDLTLDNMSLSARYRAINQALTALRGGSYEFHIKGIDELHLRHDSIMAEACNTSFQVHFQVGADEFATLYNIAQVAAAPLLAAAANSPVLFGRRLWHETRVALFQQSLDTRQASPHLRVQLPRVSFGRSWVEGSVLEIFKEDIARFRAVLSTEAVEDPFAAIAAGRAPELKALRLHSGTVYRWNRACYGVLDGKAHLRIENRILPAGPTVRDEMANAAFWYGMVSGLLVEHRDITRRLAFDDVRANFFAAAQLGAGAHLTWLDGRACPARELIGEQLLPLARHGLEASRIDGADIERYLGVIEERVRSGRTGAQWILDSATAFAGRGTLVEHMHDITAAMAARQESEEPVHTWPLAALGEAGAWQQNFLKVEQFMQTDLVTVHEDEPVELAAQLMDWNHVRHVLVEDYSNRLVGVVSRRSLLRLVGRYDPDGQDGPMPVSAVMTRDPVTAAPETPTLEAVELMRERRISCLPVVHDGRLVGLVTERVFMDIARQLLEEKLGAGA